MLKNITSNKSSKIVNIKLVIKKSYDELIYAYIFWEISLRHIYFDINWFCIDNRFREVMPCTDSLRSLPSTKSFQMSIRDRLSSFSLWICKTIELFWRFQTMMNWGSLKDDVKHWITSHLHYWKPTRQWSTLAILHIHWSNI